MNEGIRLPQRKSPNEILLFRPAGLRVDDPIFLRETDIAVIGDLNGEDWRVFKHGHLWNRDKGHLTLACEGTPLTASIAETEETRFVSIGEFLTEVWGNEVIERLKNQASDLWTSLQIHWASQITVVPVGIEEAAVKALDRVKANVILHDSNLDMANDWGKSTEEKTQIQVLADWAVKIGLGAFAMFFLMIRFWGYHR